MQAGWIGTDLIFWGFIPLPHHGPVEVHSAVASALSKRFNLCDKVSMVSPEGCQHTAARQCQRRSESRLQRCLQLRIDTVGHLTCSPAIVSVSICKTKDGCLCTHPLPHQAVLFPSIVQLPRGWPWFPGRSSNVSAREDIGGFPADLH